MIMRSFIIISRDIWLLEIFFKKGKEKIFEYVICGNTSTDEGIQAPYNENPIGSKMHFQKIDSKSDIFDFWKDNQNSDQVSNKNPDTVKF